MVASLTLLLSCAGGPVANASAPSTSALKSAAEAFLARAAAAQHLILQSESLTQTSVSTTNTTISVQYLVSETHLLNFASPDDVPIMKGFEAALRQLTALTPFQSQEIQDYIAQWRSNLASYITTPSASNSTLKVTATLAPGGSVDPASIQVFGLADENGDWAPAAAILSGIPSPSAEEANGEQAILEMASSTPPPVTLVKPTISSVTPASATDGQAVTITGTGFGATQGSGFVRAGVNAMMVVSWSDTKIVIRPEFSPTATQAGSAPITVTDADGQTATYADFSLIVPEVQPPQIRTVAIGVSATSAADQTMTIIGASFGAAQGQGGVTLTSPTGSNLQLSVQSWTSTKIVATLHSSKQAMLRSSGTYTVTVTTAQNESVTSQVAFVVLHPRPTRGPAASKAPGPDMRPFIVLAVVAALVAIGWLDLRSRQRAR